MEIIDIIKEQNAQGKKDVFLSYRSTGVNFASRLFEELEQNNIETWFDKAILHQFVGDQYKNIIHQGIDNSKILLLIYTEDVRESEFIIKEELSYAVKTGKPIFCYTKDPINFGNMGEELSTLLQNIQWLTNEENAKHINEYKDAIKDEIYRSRISALVHDLTNPYSVFEDVNLFLIRIEIQKYLGYSTPYGNYITLCNAEDTYRWENVDISIINKCFYISIPEEKRKELIKRKFLTPKGDKQNEAKEITELIERLNPERDEIRNSLYHFIRKNYALDKLYGWLMEHRKGYMVTGKPFSIEGFFEVIALYVADDFIHQIDDLKKTMFNGTMTGLYEVQDERTEDDEQHRIVMKMYYTDYFTFKCMVEAYHILRSIQDCFDDINKSNITEYAAFLSSLGIGGYIVINQENAINLMWARRSGTISSGDMWHFSFDETSNICKDGIRENNTLKIFDGNIVKIDAQKYMLRGIKEEDGINSFDLADRQGIMELGIIKSERLEVEILSYAVLNRPSEPSLPQQMEDYRRNAPDGKLEISKIEFVPLINSINKYTGRLITPEANYLSMRLNSLFNNYSEERTGIDLSISRKATIGSNVKFGKSCLVEDFTYIGDNCIIGDQCRIHRNVFIDDGIVIGNRVKIQNNNSIYSGVELKDGVFVGTNVSFTNDRYPRAIREKDGLPVTQEDWKLEKTIVGYGASIGAGATIRCGVTIGEWAMIGCGAVVVDDVKPHTTVAGNPAKPIDI